MLLFREREGKGGGGSHKQGNEAVKSWFFHWQYLVLLQTEAAVTHQGELINNKEKPVKEEPGVSVTKQEVQGSWATDPHECLLNPEVSKALPSGDFSDSFPINWT